MPSQQEPVYGSRIEREPGSQPGPGGPLLIIAMLTGTLCCNLATGQLWWALGNAVGILAWLMVLRDRAVP